MPSALPAPYITTQPNCRKSLCNKVLKVMVGFFSLSAGGRKSWSLLRLDCPRFRDWILFTLLAWKYLSTHFSLTCRSRCWVTWDSETNQPSGKPARSSRGTRIRLYNSPYCLPCIWYIVSSENLVFILKHCVSSLAFFSLHWYRRLKEFINHGFWERTLTLRELVSQFRVYSNKISSHVS